MLEFLNPHARFNCIFAIAMLIARNGMHFSWLFWNALWIQICTFPRSTFTAYEFVFANCKSFRVSFVMELFAMISGFLCTYRGSCLLFKFHEYLVHRRDAWLFRAWSRRRKKISDSGVVWCSEMDTCRARVKIYLSYLMVSIDIEWERDTILCSNNSEIAKDFSSPFFGGNFPNPG